ncbi:Dynactin p62, partial [Coniochaeta hoffmannii]
PSPSPPPPPTSSPLDIETHFDNLRSFYTAQISESNSAPGLSLTDMGLSSPSSLARLMNLYTVGSSSLDPSRKTGGTSSRRTKTSFREASSQEEGLQPAADLDESAAIETLRSASLPGTANAEQRSAQALARPSNLAEPPLHGSSRFLSSLRPIPVLLRTKRSKRCPVCRHIISKPEPKVASTRFRIRLVAGSYIPSISIRPLNPPPTTSSSSSSSTSSTTSPSVPFFLLHPHKPTQYLLTFTNPIFDPVKVTLATPTTTPGRLASRVTVLCPQFDIDANTDVWDEALRAGDARKRADERLVSRTGGVAGGAATQAEAGKIWERGRNWVSVVVEVVPASLPRPLGDGKGEEGEWGEDEDVLEIPMFVRVEWEGEAAAEVGAAVGAKESRERRELAYWCVLGVGRIARG